MDPPIVVQTFKPVRSVKEHRLSHDDFIKRIREVAANSSRKRKRLNETRMGKSLFLLN